MKIRVHNNDDTDFVDYDGDTLEDIKEQAEHRLQITSWKNGWSEVLEK